MPCRFTASIWDWRNCRMWEHEIGHQQIVSLQLLSFSFLFFFLDWGQRILGSCWDRLPHTKVNRKTLPQHMVPHKEQRAIKWWTIAGFTSAQLFYEMFFGRGWASRSFLKKYPGAITKGVGDHWIWRDNVNMLENTWRKFITRLCNKPRNSTGLGQQVKD